MRRFSFTCSYTRTTDVEGTSPCGRPATRRKHGDPKCLGHWAVHWLLSKMGPTAHARKTWAFVFWVLFVSQSFTLLQVVLGRQDDSASVHPVAILFVVPYFGGVTLALALERAFGGTLYVLTAPLAGFAMALQNRGLLRGQLASASGHGEHNEKIVDLAGTIGFTAIGLVTIAVWVGFLLFYDGKPLGEALAMLAGILLMLMVIIAGIVLALMARGIGNDLLVGVGIGLGVLVVAGGIGPVKRLARRLQV
ncbi:hypothetical protein GCM10022254_33110 [Actinomadura meridiana]|uniref:Uncharacterized protein n=1 Tax=Actinomadura meridiana TaxID=559626 RepID=A0ABP8C2M9_9ACTN